MGQKQIKKIAKYAKKFHLLKKMLIDGWNEMDAKKRHAVMLRTEELLKVGIKGEK